MCDEGSSVFVFCRDVSSVFFTFLLWLLLLLVLLSRCLRVAKVQVGCVVNQEGLLGSFGALSVVHSVVLGCLLGSMRQMMYFPDGAWQNCCTGR